MKFKIGNYNISYIGDNFKKWFGEPKIKPNTKELFSIKLPHEMLDAEILTELKPTEITLNELVGQFEMMDKYEWYLAYIRNADGVLWAVPVHWYGDGWVVFAFRVGGGCRWFGVGGSRVFSRKSFDTLNKDT